VLWFATVQPFITTASESNNNILSTRTSRVTILVGVLIVINLFLQQGCVPNAKPILDYSNIVPVCNP
jgi:hypothetical protein